MPGLSGSSVVHCSAILARNLSLRTAKAAPAPGPLCFLTDGHSLVSFLLSLEQLTNLGDDIKEASSSSTRRSDTRLGARVRARDLDLDLERLSDTDRALDIDRALDLERMRGGCREALTCPRRRFSSTPSTERALCTLELSSTPVTCRIVEFMLGTRTRATPVGWSHCPRCFAYNCSKPMLTTSCS